jgi:regulator of sigma D
MNVLHNNKQTIECSLNKAEFPLSDFCCELTDIVIEENFNAYEQIRSILVRPLVVSIQSGVYRIIEKQFRKIINDIECRKTN